MVKRASRRGRVAFTEPVTVPLHNLAPFVRMLQRQNKVGHFADSAKLNNAVFTLDPDLANFVQDFLRMHDLHDPLAQAMIDPCPDKPFC